jgi:hypothetical protein
LAGFLFDHTLFPQRLVRRILLATHLRTPAGSCFLQTYVGSVGNDGKAIVGNVTQHARVIVSDKSQASAARNTPKAAGARRGRAPTDAEPKAQP